MYNSMPQVNHSWPIYLVQAAYIYINRTIFRAHKWFGSLFLLGIILASCWHGPLNRDFLYSKNRWLSISLCWFLEEAIVCKNGKALAPFFKNLGMYGLTSFLHCPPTPLHHPAFTLDRQQVHLQNQIESVYAKHHSRRMTINQERKNKTLLTTPRLLAWLTRVTNIGVT